MVCQSLTLCSSYKLFSLYRNIFEIWCKQVNRTMCIFRASFTQIIIKCLIKCVFIYIVFISCIRKYNNNNIYRCCLFQHFIFVLIKKISYWYISYISRNAHIFHTPSVIEPVRILCISACLFFYEERGYMSVYLLQLHSLIIFSVFQKGWKGYRLNFMFNAINKSSYAHGHKAWNNVIHIICVSIFRILLDTQHQK